MKFQYSVLMSVYYKEKPEYLKQAIESILCQTVQPDDFVLVCDGPLTAELDKVIVGYKDNPIFHVVRLKENVGIGRAANVGIEHCKNELIAKMDSDDIAVPQRCEWQLHEFEMNPDLAVLGGQLYEFIDNIDNVVSKKVVPEQYNEIIKYAKRRDPFNNQTVMYKKSVVKDVGGYENLTRCEDYDLYARILNAWYLCQNLNRFLVYYRLERDTYRRRKSSENVKSFIKVRWKIHKSGFSSLMDFLIPTTAQIIMYCAPNGLQKFVYEKILRK